jgi:hypothetical protein
LSRTHRTPGLPPTHGPVGYRWQNTGSLCSLINTRATSCRTSRIGVGACVSPQWRKGRRSWSCGGDMQAHPTPRQAIRRRDSGASAECCSRCPGAGRIRAFTGCRRAQGERGTGTSRFTSRARRHSGRMGGVGTFVFEEVDARNEGGFVDRTTETYSVRMRLDSEMF